MFKSSSFNQSIALKIRNLFDSKTFTWNIIIEKKIIVSKQQVLFYGMKLVDEVTRGNRRKTGQNKWGKKLIN